MPLLNKESVPFREAVTLETFHPSAKVLLGLLNWPHNTWTWYFHTLIFCLKWKNYLGGGAYDAVTVVSVISQSVVTQYHKHLWKFNAADNILQILSLGCSITTSAEHRASEHLLAAVWRCCCWRRPSSKAVQPNNTFPFSSSLYLISECQAIELQSCCLRTTTRPFFQIDHPDMTPANVLLRRGSSWCSPPRARRWTDTAFLLTADCWPPPATSTLSLTLTL